MAGSKLRPLLAPPRQSFQDTLKPQLVRINAFFKGMAPNLSPWATDQTACEVLENLIYRGEHLATDYGFYQLDPSHLSLGDWFGAVTGYTNATDGVSYNSGIVGADNLGLTSQPVNGLFKFVRLDGTGRRGVDQIALTANTLTDVAGRLESGHFFIIGVSNAIWVKQEFTSDNGAGVDVATDRPILATNSVAWQGVAYASGLSGSSAPAGGITIFGVAESAFIFTNNVDHLYFYPNVTGGNEYTSFLSRATQLAGYAAAVGGASVGPTFTTFRAKSLCPFDGRMFYLNTEENGTRYNQRVRWSIIGDPTIVWPAFNIVSAGYNANGVGSGWVDLREFGEEGQCVLPIGEDRVAVYFRDGVAFLRRTGIPTAAYARSYVSRTRGLLGPNAVCDLGGGTHFGIFNDGWYLLTADGGWQEVGYVGTESLLESLVDAQGKRAAHKWKEWFYEDLNPAALQHVQCRYDVFLKQVRIIWPGMGSNAPNRGCTYDPQNDRLTTFDYSNVGGQNRTANVLGTTDLSIKQEVSWHTFPPAMVSTWDVEGVGVPWDFDVKYALEVGWAHGTVDGHVFQHDPFVHEYDGNPVNWRAVTLATSYGLPDKLHAIDRLWVEYKRLDPVAATVLVAGWDGAGNEVNGTGTWNLAKGMIGEPHVDHVDVRVPGHNHQVTFSGSGNVLLRSVSLEVIGDIGPSIRSEGT